jgi:hypothetical protein
MRKSPVEKTSDFSAWHLSQSNSVDNLKKRENGSNMTFTVIMTEKASNKMDNYNKFLKATDGETQVPEVATS